MELSHGSGQHFWGSVGLYETSDGLCYMEAAACRATTQQPGLREGSNCTSDEQSRTSAGRQSIRTVRKI
jgi:hypothetical protein